MFLRLFILGLFISFQTLIGQSAIFEKGESGFSFGGSFTSAKSVSAPAASMNYTHNGFLDLSMSLGKISETETYSTRGDMYVTQSPAMIVFSVGVFKQQELTTPFGIGINLSYQTELQSNADSRYSRTDYKSRIYDFGFNVAKLLPWSTPRNRTQIVISPGFSLGASTLSYLDDSGMRKIEDDMVVASLLGSVLHSWRIDSSTIFSVELGYGKSFSLETESKIDVAGFGVALSHVIL